MCGSFIAQVHLTDFLYFLHRNDPGQPVQLNCWFRFITRTVDSFRGNPCNGLSNCTTTSRVNLYNCWIRRRNRPHLLCNFSCNGSSNCTTTAVSLYCATVESEGEPSTLFEGISATARATLTAAVMSRVKLYISSCSVYNSRFWNRHRPREICGPAAFLVKRKVTVMVLQTCLNHEVADSEFKDADSQSWDKSCTRVLPGRIHAHVHSGRGRALGER